ncbi:hypothetical protein GN958_ATG20085 [Phytophthora infestans]|uniref:Uncharacterized protein n=1 Tax=Phytophthora infestans TaxID=4787 RepID=A0A8S9TV85_PHYIN|nr:hypothetical protein GN958_ATG20085 [Phytophthora infestans]
MGKLVGAASTARQSGCGRSVGCQGGKRVSATNDARGNSRLRPIVWKTWTPAMRAAMLQHSYITNSQISDLLPLIAISKGYGEARGCGVDCKADSSWAQRRLPRRKTRERDKLCQGKLQIKADRVEDPAMRAAMLQHSYITNSQISDLLPSIAISEGYGKARGCGVDCKAVRIELTDSDYPTGLVSKRCQGKLQIKADRVEVLTSAMRAAMLHHSYITNQQISDLLLSIAISEGYGEARGCGVDCIAVKVVAAATAAKPESA